jgi:Mg2+ and Co2+ transporter CorA
MSTELIELAKNLNSDMAELKILLARIEAELIKIDQQDSFAPFIEQMKHKFDDISVQMFKYTQTDQVIKIFPFLKTRVHEISEGTDVEFKLFGEEDFLIRSSNQKLFTFFKVILLLGIKTESTNIRIYQTKNSILIKQNGMNTESISFENDDPHIYRKEDEQISKLIGSLEKFSSQCHLKFSISKMVSEKGFKLQFKR